MNNTLSNQSILINQDFDSISKKALKLDNIENAIQLILDNSKSQHTLNFNISLSYMFKDKKKAKAFNKKIMHAILPFKYLSGKLPKVHCMFHDPENQLFNDPEFNIDIFKDKNKKFIDILLIVKTVMSKIKTHAKFLGTKKIMPSLNSDTVMDSDQQAITYFNNLIKGIYRKTTLSINILQKHIIFQGSFASCSLPIEHIMHNLNVLFSYLKNDLINKITCDKINILTFNIGTTRHKVQNNNYDIL